MIIRMAVHGNNDLVAKLKMEGEIVMRIKKKILSGIFSLVFVFNLGTSSMYNAAAENGQTGGSFTIGGPLKPLTHWSTSDSWNYGTTVPSNVSNYHNPYWDIQNHSEDIYRQWEDDGYKITDGEEYTIDGQTFPTAIDNTDRSITDMYKDLGGYGFLPTIETYRVPIQDLKDLIAEYIRAYARLGNMSLSDINFDVGSNWYDATPASRDYGISNHSGIDFFKFFDLVDDDENRHNNSYSTTTYDSTDRGINGKEDTVSDVINDPNNANDKEKMLNGLRDALRALGLNEDQIEDFIKAIDDETLESIRAGETTGFLNFFIKFARGLSKEEQAELMKKWYMYFYDQNGSTPASFDENIPITFPFLHTGSGGFPFDWSGGLPAYMNPLMFPNNPSTSTDLQLRTAIDSFNEFTGRGNGEEFGRGLVGPFGTEIIDGGVYDSSKMLQRYRLAMYIIEAYENAGAEWIDITRVLDCRIKKLETTQGIEDNYTGEFYWLIEKIDEATGKYVPVASYDHMGQFLNYRFTSKGHYKITRYPYYKTKTGFSIAVYACEYSFISDTRNVIFMDENFTNGSSNLPPMYSTGNNHMSYDKDEILSETDPMWRTGNGQNSSSLQDDNTPLYENEYSDCYTYDISDAELDRTILDLQNGSIRSNFDTERIK